MSKGAGDVTVLCYFIHSDGSRQDWQISTDAIQTVRSLKIVLNFLSAFACCELCQSLGPYISLPGVIVNIRVQE